MAEETLYPTTVDAKNICLCPLTEAPSLNDGTLYYNTTDGKFYFRENSAWNEIGGESFWQRVGTVISPVVADDDVDIGAGSFIGDGSQLTAIPWANINKTVSDIADITTKSHTSLTDIGTNTHTELDTFITQCDTITKILFVNGNRVDAYTEDGSESKPYKTIQSAITTASATSIIVIEPATYNENLTLKAGVYLRSRGDVSSYGVTITGKLSYPSGAGNVLLSGIYVLNTSDHAVEFTGVDAQKLRCYNCKFETNSIGLHHAIVATNTNASSELFMKNSLVQVLNSSGGAKCIDTDATSALSIGLKDTTVRIVDDTDNVAIDLDGAVVYWHTLDEIDGRVTVATGASSTISLCSMTSATQPVLTTNSAGTTVMSNTLLTTTASPAVTGAGVFAYMGVSYASTGQGLAATLNGGGGPTLGAIPFDSASNILYDNTTSGLAATLVKTAIDEVDGDLDTHIADGTIHFIEGAIDHTAILNIGTNAHSVIDTHLTSTVNPHSVTANQIGADNIVTEVNTNGTGTFNWVRINKTGSNLTDLATRVITDTTGTLTETRGGTNQTTYTTGDILYASGANTLSKLGIGTNDQVLTLVAGVPAWVAIPADAVTSVFGRTGVVVATTNDYTWAQIDKTVSSLNDVTTKRIGDATNHIDFAADGTPSFAGTARYHKHKYFYAYNMSAIAATYNSIVCGAAGAGTLNGFYFKTFDDGGGVEIAEATNMEIHLPDRYVDGTDFSITFTWTTGGVAGVVRWQTGCAAVSDGDTYSPLTGADNWATPQDITVPDTAWKRDTATFTVSGTGFTSGDCVRVVIFRDADNAADTYSGDAYITMVNINYLVDAL